MEHFDTHLLLTVYQNGILNDYYENDTMLPLLRMSIGKWSELCCSVFQRSPFSDSRLSGVINFLD